MRTIFLFVFIVIFSQGKLFGQQTASKPTEEAMLRLSLAKELMLILAVDKDIERNIDSVSAFLKRNIEQEEKNPTLAKQKLISSQTQFNVIKNKLPLQIRDRFIQELASRYTATELKYLVEINKYPLYKNFKAFQESDQYYSIIGEPYIQARRILKNEKRKPGSE